ncbi:MULTISPECIES: S24 family peptidase [unclassified Spirosoma]|uniref:S24 family peptidase n=1 Tax=unclassified Spirosoma TaxID=2621999 RepID=UPI00095E8F24|nr:MULTISPECIES: S24 family peptidase [unclassified Spirosoma]MBN8826476.1 helix-turn-helix transcriptional regulator [Spirosoma sp.]OJW76431.1 MAG: hypothetical protein BGO59_23240 [Spirosoma sp. 48-14]
MLTSTEQTKIISRVRRLIAEKADGKQTNLAHDADIQPSMMSRLLAGHEAFNRRYLLKIEKATGARLVWLEQGVEPIYYPEGKVPEREEAEFHEGSLLRAYLDSKNIEYSEFARMLNKSKNTVQGYFKTEAFSKSNKSSILKALSATEADVFGGVPAYPAPARIRQYVNEEPAATYERLRPIRVDDTDMFNVLRIPIRARAGLGYHAYFNENQDELQYNRVPGGKIYPGVPPERHVIVEVNGDSMEPVMEHGYEMLAYELPHGHFPNYVKYIMVDFRDELTIKSLAAIDYIEGTLTLRSLNGGAEMRISMDEIRKAWHVYDYYKAKL